MKLKRILIQFVFLLVCMQSTHAADLREVEMLVESGASHLALQVLDQQQARIEDDKLAWLAWEQQRIRLYQRNKQWGKLIKRLSSNPEWVPKEYQRWSLEQIALAQIEQKQINAALKTLRKLIWSERDDEAKSPPAGLARWRQLVIRAYLVDENIQDAEVAMLRFHQDNPKPTSEWKRLRATVLIRAGRYYDAQVLMKKETHLHSRSIYYLAKLLAGKASPKKILARMQILARKRKFAKSTQRRFWLVASRAASHLGDYPSAIHAMQQALLLSGKQEVINQEEKLLFPANGKLLWKLYEDYGRKLGNGWQLLLGNDEAWFSKASNLVDKKPMQAMALFAVMISDTERPRTRKLAHELFADLMSKGKKGLLLVQHLYLNGADDGMIEFIPEKLRHRLIDDALAQSNVKTASKLISAVNEPPKGANAVFWKMRRARIMILAGELDNGIKALQDLVKATEVFQPGEMDRLMQVLFDLQTVGKHKQAIALFKSLPMQGQSGKQRRELLYWIADSYKNLKEYVPAARYYLMSAALFNPQAMDQWAQTARYQAAEALLLAGNYQDAGNIFKGLLKITKEQGRKVVLRNKIQQIWLQSNQEREQQ